MLTSFGKYLRTFRIQHDKLLKDMAEDLNVAPAYLSSIENGKRKPTRRFMKKIIDTYNFDTQKSLELEEAYCLSMEEVELDMKDASDMQKNLGIAFARKFNSLSEEQIEEIRKALNRGGN